MAETARLRLRTWDDADVAPFIARMNNAAVMQWLGGVQTEAEAKASITRWRTNQQAQGFGFWLVERRSDGAVLGFCGLKRCDAEGATMRGDMEIGWRFAPDAWGHGYAYEAAEACLTLAFTRFAAPHVVALTVRENAPSWGLAMRLGMVRAHALDFTGGFVGAGAHAIIVYTIARRDWMQ